MLEHFDHIFERVLVVVEDDDVVQLLALLTGVLIDLGFGDVGAPFCLRSHIGFQSFQLGTFAHRDQHISDFNVEVCGRFKLHYSVDALNGQHDDAVFLPRCASSRVLSTKKLLGVTRSCSISRSRSDGRRLRPRRGN